MSYDVYFTINTGKGEHTVAEFNHTSNTAEMMAKALNSDLGIKYLNGRTARDVEDLIRSGVQDMVARDYAYRKHEPENGWGSFESTLQFLCDICKTATNHPACKIRVTW